MLFLDVDCEISIKKKYAVNPPHTPSMNLKTVRVKIIILFILGCISHQLFSQVNFEEMNLETAQSEIAATQTPYLIYFSGVWCPSCQLMEETTFTDQKLGDQIQENYLAYKVDIDSKEGKKWIEEYAVTCLPTTIFYSANGQLLKRFEKPITSTEMLAMTTKSSYKNSSLIATNVQNNKVKNSLISSNLSAKNKKTEELIEHLTKRTNNPPNGKISTEQIANFSTLIEELGAEIKGLKAFKQSTTDNTKSKSATSTNVFTGINSNVTVNLNNRNAILFLSSSNNNLLAQISACKALLTDVKSLDKLIGILENYQRLLIEMKATQIQLAQQAIPSERTTTNLSKKTISNKNKVENQSDLFTRNQLIINHLKLKEPINNGNQYIVQLGKFSNVRNAERLVQIIQDKYDYPIKVLIENKNNLPIQTVYLGEFKTKKEALAANENLKWIKRKGVVKRF